MQTSPDSPPGRENKPDGPFTSMKEFWPFYVSEHLNPRNRLLHFLGTSGAIFMTGLAAYFANPWLLIAVPVFGYGAAWFGHFIFERNKPAAFQYPFRSFAGDLRMWLLMLTFQMNGEIRRLREEGKLS